MPQATIAALAEGSWIDDRESVILIGDSGTGKTHLATALAVCACQAGRRVRFTTLAGLANELQEAEGRRELARVVARYARTELVVLDELGLPRASPTAPPSSSSRSSPNATNAAALIVTTNLPFGEWTKVFPDPRLAKAVVDRLTHRAHIIDTGTESWRFHHGLTQNKRRRAHHPHDPDRAALPPLRSPTARSGTAARRTISYQSKDRKPDGGWGHFKPSRWGQCKPSRRLGYVSRGCAVVALGASMDAPLLRFDLGSSARRSLAPKMCPHASRAAAI